MHKFLKLNIIFLSFPFVLSLYSYAETKQGVENYTQRKAIRWALENNKSLSVARREIDQKLGIQMHEGRLSNPDLRVSYSNDAFFENEGESALEVGFQQKIPLTNRLKLTRQMAEIEVKLAQLRVKDHERVIERNVALAFNEYALAQAQLKLSRELFKTTKQYALFIESRLKTGEASLIDRNQIKIELYSVEQEIQVLENELLKHLVPLKKLMNLDIGKKINIIHSFEIPKQLSLSLFSEQALLDHPKYKLQKKLLMLSKIAASKSSAEKWDDLGVELFFESKDSLNPKNEIEKAQFFGVELSMPLPLYHHHSGIVEAAKAKTKMTELKLDSVVLSIKTEEQLWRKMVINLFNQANIYRQNIKELMATNHADIEKAYGNGQIDLTALFRSLEQQFKVESAYLKMLHDYEEARVQLCFVSNQRIS